MSGTVRGSFPVVEYGKKRCGSLPTSTEQIFGEGEIRRVASITTVIPSSAVAGLAIGVNTTAGSPV